MNTSFNFKGCVLHDLKADDGVITLSNGGAFDGAAYSKFKYGEGESAEMLGHQLAKKFISDFPTLFVGQDKDTGLVLTTTPYDHVPKGANGILKGFKNYLNNYLLRLGKEPVLDVISLKVGSFEGDYGTFSAAEREQMINRSRIFAYDEFLKGKKLVIIDDVRITGAHERNLIAFFKDKELAETYFLYAAAMDPEYAKQNPKIESQMNHLWMDSLDKLLGIVNSSRFMLNARVCKYVLSQKNTDELAGFFSKLDGNRLYALYNGIVAEGYGSMGSYKVSFGALCQEMEARGLLKNAELLDTAA